MVRPNEIILIGVLRHGFKAHAVQSCMTIELCDNWPGPAPPVSRFGVTYWDTADQVSCLKCLDIMKRDGADVCRPEEPT